MAHFVCNHACLFWGYLRTNRRRVIHEPFVGGGGPAVDVDGSRNRYRRVADHHSSIVPRPRPSFRRSPVGKSASVSGRPLPENPSALVSDERSEAAFSLHRGLRDVSGFSHAPLWH